MTAAILGLPLMAGSAVATSAGRVGLWALGHFARAPLASTAIIALTSFSALAGANALYFQTSRHPAPFFAPSISVAATPAPELSGDPVLRPGKKSQPVVLMPRVTSETTGSLSPDGAPIGNSEVFQLQQKLAEMRLFDGTVDGYYGPMTAKAIRAFELANGLKPTGALTPEIVATILRAPAAEPIVMQTPVVHPQPEPEPLITASIAAPQPKPEPLPVLQASAEPDPFIAAAESAEQAVDVIAGAIQTLNASRANSQLTATLVTAVVTPPTEVATTTTEPLATLPPLDTEASNAIMTTDPRLVSKVQRGLSSLGFLHGSIDGVAGEATAKAIRNFEVYYNYESTGQVTPDLLDLLVERGAVI
jgi:peptidoglycan hydrolase-like protein with peptidoglycan-binding domain